MASAGISGEAFAVSDVFLLTDGNDGRVAVPNLHLTFGTTGIELAKDDGQLVWQSSWVDLSELSTAERSLLDDGREGVVLVVVEQGGRHHRFVLPSADPDETESSMRAVAAAHQLHSAEPTRSVSRLLSAAVGLAAVGTIVVLVLSASHVIHF